MSLTSASVAPSFSSASSSSGEMINRCMIDDVNGDGSLLVDYVEVYSKQVVDGSVQSSLAGSFTDETCTVAYTPANPVEPCEIGQPAKICPRFHKINGMETFQIPAVAVSYSVTVCDIGNPANPPYIDDGTEQTTLDKVGLVIAGNAESSLTTGIFSQTPSIVTAEAGDILIVSWNEVC